MQASFSYGATNYTPIRFERLLKYLTENGFQFVSINEIGGELKPKSVLITFDDAYAHLREHLPRFIEQYKIKPLIFVPTAFIGQNNSWDYSHRFQNCPHMDETTIKELSLLGVDFGSHSESHPDLTTLTDLQLQLEMQKSKDMLENLLGKKVNSLCYPYGRFDKRVMESAEMSGYEFAFTMRFPHASDTNLSIGRFPVYGLDLLMNIKQRINHGMLYQCERLKCLFFNKLSYGTTLLNQFKK